MRSRYHEIPASPARTAAEYVYMPAYPGITTRHLSAAFFRTVTACFVMDAPLLMKTSL
jgi:hypothetical protein